MNNKLIQMTVLSIITASSLVVSDLSMARSNTSGRIITKIGADNNSINNPFVQPQDPALAGDGRDQSLQFGDVLFGTVIDDLLIGGLGTDVFAGGPGNDVVIGGVEHFNPSNRDRAYGGSGDDIFIWKPGDGSDLWNGGSGYDVVVFGLIGEEVDGNVEFSVINDQQNGKIAIDPATQLPTVDVTNSPGFCDVIDASSSPDAASELKALDLDHLVRFSIRSIADAFEAGEQSTDNGLRVTLHLKDVEAVICTNRAGGVIEMIDLTTTPPRLINGVNRRIMKRLQRLVF